MAVTESRRNQNAESASSTVIRRFGPRFGTERPLVRIQSPRPTFLANPHDTACTLSDPIGRGRALSVSDRDGNGSRTESQGEQLEFPIEQKEFPAHPTVIMRWDDGRLEAYWPEFGMRARFYSWPAAIASVLHPINDHVRLKVRA